MLSAINRMRGATLIELMIGVVIMAILFGLGIPSFREWLQNTQIRTAAEAIQNGLQLARVEAVKRNTFVRFQLVTTLDGSCLVSNIGSNWVVSVGDASASGDPSSQCGNAPSEVAAPFIIQKRSGAEGSKNAQVAATQPLVVFNGLGRATNVAATGVAIDITNNSLGGTVGNCVAGGGEMRCLRVVVSAGGLIRMCDPAVALSPTTPQGC